MPITYDDFLSDKKFKDNYFGMKMKYNLLTNDISLLNTLNDKWINVKSVSHTGFVLDGHLHGKTALFFNELSLVEE